MSFGTPVSLDISGTLVFCGGKSRAMMLSLNSAEYLVFIVFVGLTFAPKINTKVSHREATPILTQGGLLSAVVVKKVVAILGSHIIVHDLVTLR